MPMRFNKATGPKPTTDLLQEASILARAGTKDHMAVAMALRPEGVTQNEIVRVLGHPHRNKIKQLLRSRTVKVIALPDQSRSMRIKLVRNA